MEYFEFSVNLKIYKCQNNFLNGLYRLKFINYSN